MINNQSTTFFKTLHDDKKHRLAYPKKPNLWYQIIFRLGSFIIAVFIPVIGLCIHILYKDDRPKDAIYPLAGVLISLSTILLFTTILIIAQAYHFNGIPALQQALPEWVNDFLIPIPRELPDFTF
ncbi:MAG: hypothetical protein ACOCU1_01725 [Bacillota bacterium]